jgi:hypothetical protein
MSRSEVLSNVGHPKYIASSAGDEYLWYDVQRSFGSAEPHYVKLVNGRVESHGAANNYPDAPGFAPAR